MNRNYKDLAKKGKALIPRSADLSASECVNIIMDASGPEKDALPNTIADIWYFGFYVGYQQAKRELLNGR